MDLQWIWITAVLLFGTPLLLLLLVWLYVACLYPSWEEPLGPYKMVGMSTHRVPKSVRFKMFYPSNEHVIGNQGYRRPEMYTDWRCFDGISRYSTLPEWVFWYLNLFGCTLPCLVNAPPLRVKEQSILPLVIFSHGLIGNWDIYSQLCIHLASFGIIVAAVDFDDGSASFTISGADQPLFYERPFIMDEQSGEKRMLGMDATRTECQIFRGPQLRHRVRRTSELINYLKQCTNEEEQRSDDHRLCEIIKCADLKKLFLIGHSFGGCSHILFAKQQSDDGSNHDSDDDEDSECDQKSESKVHICGVVGYEPWVFATSDEELNSVWPQPYLCIIGNRWTAGNLWKYTRIMGLSNGNHCSQPWNAFEFGDGFKHPSFSDVLFWSPDWFGRPFGAQFGDVISISEQSSIIVGRTLDFMVDVLIVREGFSSDTPGLPSKMNYNRNHLRNCWDWAEEREHRFDASETSL